MIQKFQKKFFTILLLTALNLSATIDYLDTTFGPNANGIVTTILNTSSSIGGITTNASGQIIAVGSTYINNVQNLVAARYNSNGAIDTTFATSGVFTSLANSTSAVANAVTVDSSSRIIIVGGNANAVVVIRLTTTGVLDSTFGTGGIVTLTPGGNVGEASSVIIDANGKILICGASNSQMLIARFNTNGTIDTTFNTTGYNLVTVNGNDTGNSITIDQNAKIVIGGSTIGGGGTNFSIVRLTSAGVVDTTFGTSGSVVTQIPSENNNSVQSIMIDSSNRIIAAGYGSVPGTNAVFALARYSNAGVIDTTFGTGGTGIVTTSIGVVAQIFGATLDQSGNIFTAGLSDNQVAAARYTPNGSLDTTFGISGIITTTVNSNGSQMNAVTVQASDGRVVAGGFETLDVNTGDQAFALIRYNKNNTDFVNITSIANNGSVNTKIPVVSGTSSGTTSPQASVQVIVNGVTLTTVNTDSSGNWNAGNTNVLPVGLNTIQVNLIISSVVVVSHVTLFTVIDNLGEDAVFAYNSTSQTKTTSTFTSLPFNNLVLGTSGSGSVGTWAYNSGTNTFTCNKSGRYQLTYHGCGGLTAVGSGATAINVATALFINGSEYLGSENNSNIDVLTVSSVTNILAKGLVKDLNAGDTITLQYGITITGSTSTYAPGLIVNPNSSGTQNAYSIAIMRIS